MARLIAIDLGAWSVKVAVWAGVGREHVYEGCYAQRVPDDGGHLPSVHDRLASLDILLRQHAELAEPHLAEVVWSSHRSSVRRLVLPFADKEQIEQTLPFAIESEVPFELDDMLLAWRRGPEPGEVLAVVAQEDGVSTLIAGLTQRHLDPRRVVPDGEVLGRLATSTVDAEPGPLDEPSLPAVAGEGAHPSAAPITAIIDVGHAHTVVTIARDRQALFFRSLDVAGRSFTRAIQESIGCTWGEAERLKHGEEEDDEDTLSSREPRVEDEATDPAFGARLPEKAREALHGAIGLLLAEVRSTLIQAEDEIGKPIDELVLCGGGSRISELPTWLEQDLGLPLRSVERVLGVGIRPEQVMSRALGDWMAHDDGGRSGARIDRIDMRTGELSFHGSMDTSNLIFRFGGAFLGSFLIAACTMFALQYWTMMQEHAAVDARVREIVLTAVPELPETTDTTGAVVLLGEMVASAEEDAKVFHDADDPPPTIHELFVMSKAFPPHDKVKVNVDRLEITPGAINLNGVTEGFSQVDDIEQSLFEVGHYNKVEKSPGNRDNKGRLQFTMNIDRTDADDPPSADDGTQEDG